MNIKDNTIIQHVENGGEYTIPSTCYEADEYSQVKHKIYEFLSNFRHTNLDIYHPNFINNVTNTTMDKLDDATMKRHIKIVSLGYDIEYIWESDWDENKRI